MIRAKKRYKIALFIFIVIAAFIGITALRAADTYHVDPFKKSNNSWITISGIAVAPLANSFTLDYGQGAIKVEMDDDDWYHEGHKITDGHHVMVSGRIDENLYSLTTIEAGNVYDQDLNQYFYASSRDEERWHEWSHKPVKVGRASLHGVIRSISPKRREFTIDTGTQVMTIDTWGMPYNPLDTYGAQQLEVGDRVIAQGDLTRDSLTGKLLAADSVITVIDGDTQRSRTKVHAH